MVLSQETEQRMIQVGIEYPWMNIALAANARSVAQLLRSRFYSLNYVFLSLRLGFEVALHFKLAHGNDRPSPGTKILRCEVLAAEFRARQCIGRVHAPVNPGSASRSWPVADLLHQYRVLVHSCLENGNAPCAFYLDMATAHGGQTV
jgi:hypothetical protein